VPIIRVNFLIRCSKLYTLLDVSVDSAIFV